MSSLDRFHKAQAGAFETALAELRAGRKRSHWIWFVFPQLAGLGRSSTAQFYALHDLEEARDYLCDPVLRDRLIAAASAVDDALSSGTRLVDLMNGEVDSLKLVSSLTLFQRAIERLDEPGISDDLARLASFCERILKIAEGQGFPRCEFTLAQCG